MPEGYKSVIVKQVVIFDGPILDASPRSERPWASVIQPLLVLLAFIVGMLLSRSGANTWSETWSVLFVSVGALCIGVGVGFLISRRRQDAGADALRADFDDLSRRADLLAEEWEFLRIKQKL